MIFLASHAAQRLPLLVKLALPTAQALHINISRDKNVSKLVMLATSQAIKLIMTSPFARTVTRHVHLVRALPIIAPLAQLSILLSIRELAPLAVRMAFI